jgi:hypothetical protein
MRENAKAKKGETLKKQFKLRHYRPESSFMVGSIGRMSETIRDRLVALALRTMTSAAFENDESGPRSLCDICQISLLERLYRLRLMAASSGR